MFQIFTLYSYFFWIITMTLKMPFSFTWKYTNDTFSAKSLTHNLGIILCKKSDYYVIELALNFFWYSFQKKVFHTITFDGAQRVKIIRLSGDFTLRTIFYWNQLENYLTLSMVWLDQVIDYLKLNKLIFIAWF
jgi:hypothetical protein